MPDSRSTPKIRANVASGFVARAMLFRSVRRSTLMKKAVTTIVGLGALALASQAQAQDVVVYDVDVEAEEEPGPYSYAWYEPGLDSGIGIGVILGGGLTGFTDEGIRDVVRNDVGGLWDVRVSIGTHIPLGVDLSYVGTASELETIDNISSGTLIGTALEAAARFNILPHYMWNPYVFGGIGWQHYDVTDTDFEPEDIGMRENDDMLMFPLGAGMSFRDPSGFVADVRGTFRLTDDSSLFIDEEPGNEADLHTWEASAAIGYEF
jgi:hypothetical protein